MITKLLRSVLMLAVAFTFCAGAVWAQETGTIEGTITGQETGDPLIGANVYFPELNRGTSTDVDGEFTLTDIPYGNYELRVSYIGYTTENIPVTLDQATVVLNITLASSVGALDELVVVGIGGQTQINELTFSAEKLDVEEITSSGTADYLQALSGKVAGLSVGTRSGIGASTDIILRGVNSLTGNNQPLFVVDGVPYASQRFNTASAESGFSGYDFGSTALDINPANIASMTVLKGAAATALYGSRAANGAIIITTKQGAPANQQVVVSFNSSVGVSMVDESTFPTYQTEYGAGYFPDFLKIANPFETGPDSIISARYPADASYGPAFDPDMMVYQWDAYYPSNPNFGEATPWMASESMPIDFFETGTNVTNSIFVRGGINQGGGYYSLGYTQDNVRGIMPNSELGRYKLSFAAGYDVSENLRVDASIDYSRTDALGRPRRGYSTIMSEFRQWWQTNVSLNAQEASYFRNRQNITWNLVAGRTGPYFWNNPYWDRYENFATDTRDRYVGYADVQYDVAEWLSLTGRVSTDAYNSLIETRINVGSTGVSNYTRRTRDYSAYNFRFTAAFNRQLSDNFELDGRVGVLARRTQTISIEATTLGGLITPGLFSLDNSLNPVPFPDELDVRTGLNAIYTGVNLGYNDFIFLRATARRDKSSALPEDNNVYFYPSLSGSLLFSELVDADWLSLGKIRASIASVGATAPPLSLRDVFIRGDNFGSATQFNLPETKNNPNLEPEITDSWEIGLQLGLFNSQLYLDATYYNGSTYNQIFPVSISGATGFNFKFVNAGQIDNDGIEIALTGRPVTTNTFSWTVSANWSKNYSEVAELAPGIDYFQFVGPQGGVSIGAEVGEPLGVIRGSAFVINEETGLPVVDQETGYYLQSASSNEVIGNMLPDWRAGVSNRLNYKNWALNFLVDVNYGGDIFSLDQWYGQGTGLYPNTVGINRLGNPIRDAVYIYDDEGEITGLVPEDERGGVVLPGVTPDGEPNTKLAPVGAPGALGYSRSPTEAYLYDGTYVKLREVGLTYNLPADFLESIGVVNDASLSLVGRNLWIIYKDLPYADPEASLTAGSVQGYSGGNLPAVRSVSFNIQLNF